MKHKRIEYVVMPSGCWVCTSHYLNKCDGYPMIRISGKKQKIARVILAMRMGMKSLPAGACALHTCDCPQCIRPDHLFVGTQRDNVQDCIRKGRLHRARGEKQGASKLKKSEVLKMREKWDKTVERYGMLRKLAREFGVHPSTAASVVYCRSWR